MSATTEGLRELLYEMLRIFQARPDIYRLTGPAERAVIERARDLNNTLLSSPSLPAVPEGFVMVRRELIDACHDLVATLDADTEGFTQEEWASLGSAKLHAEDRIRAMLATGDSPNEEPQHG